MRNVFTRLCTVACFALAAIAQTITTTDDEGNTIIEVITLDPLGLVTTEIIETIPAALTTPPVAPVNTPTSTSSTTTPPQIVGQPPPTDESAPPTTYVYTTTDADGDTTQLTAVFTPTFAPTVLPPETTTGSILDVSEWLSMIGGTSAAAAVASGNGATSSADRRWLGMAAGTVLGVLGGAWLVLA